MPAQNGSSRSSALALAALILALVAVALAAWALFRSSQSDSEPVYTAAQRSDAQVKVCAAYDLVREGVSINTNLQPPGGPADVTGALAVAANARVALYDGGQYLLARLDPATSPDLSDAVLRFANDLMDIGAAATAGAQNTDPDQAARLQNADAVNTRLQELCSS